MRLAEGWQQGLEGGRKVLTLPYCLLHPSSELKQAQAMMNTLL